MAGLSAGKLAGLLGLAALSGAWARSAVGDTCVEASGGPGSPTSPPRRFEVKANRRELGLAGGGGVILTAVLPADGRLTLLIKDGRGSVVRTLLDEDRPAGSHEVLWDGLGDGRRRLVDAQYFWVARLDDGTRRQEIDLTNERDGDAEVKSHPAYEGWNPFENKPLRVRHVFDRPGEITLVFSRETYYVQMTCDPPKFCRFLDGMQPSGEFVYEWAGVDDTGALRDDIHGIFVISHHEDLSRNGIVVHGGRPTVSAVFVEPASFIPGLSGQDVCFTVSSSEGQGFSAVVTFTNQESRSVLRTVRSDSVGSGRTCLAWDGRSDAGGLVAPGRYTVRVGVRDDLGQRGTGEILTTVEY